MVPTPAAVPGHELLELLGRGGMGTVWRARDLRLGREVAIKLLHAARPAAQERFAREGQLAAAVEHPGIVRVHSTGTTAQRQPYLICELIEGARSLEEAFRTADLRQRVEWVAQAAEALGAAHARGIVHRDVKPENLLVDAEGRLKVADFGLATAVELERLTQSGALLGTPLFMAPEQLSTSSEPGPTTDVWALGCVLYLALTGVCPFEAQNMVELAGKISRGQPEPPRARVPALPAALEAVCLQAISVDPRRRQPDGAALAAQLQAWLTGRAPLASGAPRGPRRGALFAGAGALLLLAAGGWASFEVSRPRPAPEPAPAAPDLSALTPLQLEELVSGRDPQVARQARLLLARAVRAQDPARALRLLEPLEPRERLPEEALPRLFLRLAQAPPADLEPMLEQESVPPAARSELAACLLRLLDEALARADRPRLTPLLRLLRGSRLSPEQTEGVLRVCLDEGRIDLLLLSGGLTFEETLALSEVTGPIPRGQVHDRLCVVARKLQTEKVLSLAQQVPLLEAVIRMDLDLWPSAVLPRDEPLGSLLAAPEELEPARAHELLRATPLLGPIWRARLLAQLPGDAPLAEALALDPTSPDLQVRAARLALERLDPAEAERCLSRALEVLGGPSGKANRRIDDAVLTDVLRRLGDIEPQRAARFRSRFRQRNYLEDPQPGR